MKHWALTRAAELPPVVAGSTVAGGTISEGTQSEGPDGAHQGEATQTLLGIAQR